MPLLIRYLMKCFGDSDMRDAADAAHDAFAELLKQWDTVRSPKAWLRTVAFRQMLRRPVGGEQSLDMLRQEPVAVSASLEFREETQAVLDMLGELPAKQRRVFALTYDGFPPREIAQIMGISETAVRKNVERARYTLKKLHEST